MTSSPKLAYIYDRYKKASSKRKASIELRISYNYKQKYISTGIEIYPKQWKNDCVVNHPEAYMLNQKLGQLLMDVRQIIMDMEASDSIDIFSIPKMLEAKKNGGVSLFDFFKQRAEVRKYGKYKDTAQRYDGFLRLLKEYGKINSFKDITEANIISYDNYLKSKGMKANSI